MIVSRVRRVFENEELYHALVQGRRFGAYRRSYRLNVRISGAGGVRLFSISELANWGENATGDISVAAGESCLFPITMRGTVASSEISQKPAHGKLKKLNASSYEYTAKARYKGSDTFAIRRRAKGRRPRARRSLPCRRRSNSVPRAHCMVAARAVRQVTLFYRSSQASDTRALGNRPTVLEIGGRRADIAVFGHSDDFNHDRAEQKQRE